MRLKIDKLNTNYEFNLKVDFNIKPNYNLGETDEEADRIGREISKLLIDKNSELVQEVNSNPKFCISEKTSENDNSITLKNAFELWQKKKIEKDEVTDMIKKINGSINLLYRFLGENFKIKELSRNTVNELSDKFLKVPITQIPKYKLMDINQLIELNLEMKTLSKKTINGHFGVYYNMFKWLKKENYIENNYFEDIDKYNIKEEDEDSYIEYSFYELKLLNDNLKPGRIRDMFLISLYSGMRISEILLLKKTDIHDNFFDIKKGKTVDAKRKIYIHDNIRDIVDRNLNIDKDEFLIYGTYEDDNDDYKKRISNIGKIIRRAMKKHVDEELKTFHSLRKNFIQKLHDYGTKPEDKFQLHHIEILSGHSVNSLNHNSYNLKKFNDNFNKLMVLTVQYDFD